MFDRTIAPILQSWIGRGKTILLYGARQTGKTTLVKKILQDFGDEGLFIDCEIVYNREAFAKPDDIILKNLLRGKKLLVIDEAQKIINIWSVLKVIHDHIPEVQVIATGSSSFELSKHASENLTGRSIEFILYPLSIKEISTTYNTLQLPSKIDQIIQYGLYPGVFDRAQDESIETLKSIVNNYLYKDILEFAGVRKSELIINLLQLIALQIGNEVSYTELAQKLGINTVTVQNYIDLLEKSFVIYKLKWLSRNLRNEITKSVKIYFWDLWICNSLINNFNPKDLRSDIWWLRENFCITERMKRNSNEREIIKSYFRRTYTQQEIDYIEEKDGQFFAFEFKSNSKSKAKIPQLFHDAYPNSNFVIINPDNILDFVS